MHSRHAAQQLRDKARKYRALARQVSDDETTQRIRKLVDELEQQALDMDIAPGA